MTKLKTTNIQGKAYVEVNERLKYFRSQYPGYSLISEVVEATETTILIKATVFDDNQNDFTGIAQEVKGSSFINKTSYVENCETSAWGRALGNFGIGIDEAVASYNEVANAIKQSNTPLEDSEEELPLKEFNLEEVLVGIKWYRENRPEMSEEQIFQKIVDTYKDVDDKKIKLIKQNLMAKKQNLKQEIEKLRSDDFYYGDGGKKYLSNSDIKFSRAGAI